MDMSQFLKPEHRAAGITLEEYEDYLELSCPGQKPIRFGRYALIEAIQFAANQMLLWLSLAKSGVKFAKEVE